MTSSSRLFYKTITGLILILSFFIAFSGNVLSAASREDIHTKLIHTARKASVSIRAKLFVGAYNTSNGWQGSGFIVNKKEGIIVTNAHIAKAPSITDYIIEFHDGQKKPGKLLYYDLYRDFALLKFDVSGIQNSVEQIDFNKDGPNENEFVFVVSNSEGRGFSFHQGYVSDIFTTSGHMSQHSYNININTRAGASGSAVLNKEGKCLGITYAGSESYSIALNIDYVKDAVNAFLVNKKYKRQTTGLIYSIKSLSDMLMHRNLDQKVADDYIKKFPKARGKIIAVRSTIGGYDTGLEPGDFIWSVNDKIVGPDLYHLDRIIDNFNGNSIKFEVYRDGNKKVVNVNLFDVDKNKVKRMLKFAGATFFESDDLVSRISGNRQNTIGVCSVDSNSPFASHFSFMRDVTMARILSLNGNNVTDFKSLVTTLKKIKDKKYVELSFINYVPYETYGRTVVLDHEKITADLVLNPADNKFQIFEFDEKKMEWVDNTQKY